MKDNTKSDMPYYYGAAVILLVISCISIVVIARNVYGAASTQSSVVMEEDTSSSSEDIVSQTEGTLRISHAGMAGYGDGASDVEKEPSDALRSKR